MKKKRISLLITLAAALTIAGLWYFWPRSLWDILPYYTQPEEAFTSCYAILSPFDPGDGLPIQTVEFPLDSPTYDQLKELLDSSSYRRGLSDLFRLGRALRHPGSHPVPIRRFHLLPSGGAPVVH